MERGTSVMQPVSQIDLDSKDKAHAPAAPALSQGPGSLAFAALAEADVAAEDVFFHRYFTMERVKQRRAAAARTRALKRKAKKKECSSDDEDGVDIGEDDDSVAEDRFLDDIEDLPVRITLCS